MFETRKHILKSKLSGVLGSLILGVFIFGLSRGLAIEVTLAWDANIEPDIAGYRVYHGSESRSYSETVDVGNETTAIIDLSIGQGETRHFAVTAYNTFGLESDYSEEVVYTASVPNEPPIAGKSSLTVVENDTVAFTLPASDANGDVLTFAIVSEPQHGTLTGTVPQLVYVPDPDYSGPDEFTFSASDGEFASTGLVIIEVTPVDPPGKIEARVLADGSVKLSFLLNVGEIYEVQRSPDLVDWTHVGYGVAETPDVEFLVDPVDGGAAGFFRLVIGFTH